MKLTKILIFVFILLFMQNLFAFNPTFYVGDGVSGTDPNCQNPNYSSIQAAANSIKNDAIQNAIIIVCQGTYTENINLTDFENLSIIGENDEVIIKSPATEVSPLQVFFSTNIGLKNLKIIEPNLKGVVLNNVTDVILEDISVSEIKGIAQGEYSLAGIYISGSDNVTLKGDIKIEDVDASIKYTNGIEIRNSEGIVFDTDLLVVYNIKSSNNATDSLLTGILINNSDIEIKSNVTISELNGRKDVIGFLAENDSVVTNENEINMGVTQSRSLSVIKGFAIENSRINLNDNTRTNFFSIGGFQADTYAFYLDNAQVSWLGELEFIRVIGEDKSYGLYINNSDNFIVSKIDTDNTQIEGEVRLIYIKDSDSGQIKNITNGNEEIMITTNDFRVLNIINSSVKVNKMRITSNRDLPNCIVAENNSNIELEDIDFTNCLGNYIKNNSSEISIKNSPTINLAKIQYDQSQNSIVEVYKPVKLLPYKDGRDLKLDELYIYHDSKYFSNIFNPETEIEYDLLYFTKGYKNGVLDSSFYNDYYFTGIKSRVNEKKEKITINDFSFQEIYIEFFSVPNEFLEQTAKAGVTTKNSDHFSVTDKTCSKTLDKSYGCFDIKLSLALEDTENESYTLKFKLPVSWLTQKNLKKDEIVLYHLENNKYVEQKTTPLTIVDNYQIFISEVDSFSEFQIAEKKDVSDVDVPKNDTPPETTPPVTEPPADSNQTNPNCNIKCTENQILDYINCKCIDKQTGVCDLVCDSNEYLDTELCQCFDLANAGCRGACNVGETMNLTTCTCVPVVLDGMPISQANNFWSFVLIVLVIVIAIIVFLIIRKNRKNKLKKQSKKKK